MQSPTDITLDLCHQKIWQLIHPLLKQKKLAQSLLLVGPEYANMMQLAQVITAHLLCSKGEPCKKCPDCQMIMEGHHPDITYLQSDSRNKSIKVDDIRKMQLESYQTPQRGLRRVIILMGTEQMNLSASNALLKILEEPPAHLTFILLAEQIGTILPTILSRCQRFVFQPNQSASDHRMVNYLEEGEQYAPDSGKGQLALELGIIVKGLCEVLDESLSPCELTEMWSKYDLEDLLWWLYLLNAQAIKMVVYGDVSEQQEVLPLVNRINPVGLFACIQEITAIRKKIIHNVTINQNLALEHLLMTYMRKRNG